MNVISMEEGKARVEQLHSIAQDNKPLQVAYTKSLEKSSEIEEKEADYGAAKETHAQQTNKLAPMYRISTGAELAAKVIPPIRWIVEDLLPEGLGVLGGPPKSHKSFFALDMCLSIANGTPFLGFQTRHSRPLYIALEDSERRLKERAGLVLGHPNLPEDFLYMTKCPTLGNGFILYLEDFLTKNRDCHLVVVDIFQKIRASNGGRLSLYAEEYVELTQLKDLADRLHVAILLAHHTRKLNDSGDAFNRLAGSTAILGVPDTLILFANTERDSPNATLMLTGRDVIDETWPITFDGKACRWIREKTAKERARECFVNEPLTRIIRDKLDDRGGVYTARVSELVVLTGIYRATSMTPDGVGAWLRDNVNNLKRLGIETEKKRGNPNYWQFTKTVGMD